MRLEEGQLSLLGDCTGWVGYGARYVNQYNPNKAWQLFFFFFAASNSGSLSVREEDMA